jgi:hypothetical protein
VQASANKNIRGIISGIFKPKMMSINNVAAIVAKIIKIIKRICFVSIGFCFGM